jgi:hypothetical protein
MRTSLNACSLLLAILCSILLLMASAASPVPGGRASALSQPGLPVEVANVSAHSNLVTKTVTLKYSVMNRSSNLVDDLSLVVALFDSTGGHLRGMQRTCQRVGLLAGESKDFSLQLSNLHYFPPTEQVRLVVAASGGKTGSQTWSIDAASAKLVQAMARGQSLPAGTLLWGAQPNGCPADFCVKCKADAKELCTRGVKSYSCSVNGTCECNFECFGLGE